MTDNDSTHRTSRRRGRRTRRLRKKLRIGEFREFGFELAMQLVPNADDEFWDDFIVECIERRGLSFGGADTGYLTRAGRGSVSPDDRLEVGEWLAQRVDVSAYELGPLEDVWHPAVPRH